MKNSDRKRSDKRTRTFSDPSSRQDRDHRNENDGGDGEGGKGRPNRTGDRFSGRSRRNRSSRGSGRNQRSGGRSANSSSSEAAEKGKVANPELLEDLSPGAFSELGLAQEIVTPLRAIGISTPTPIQLQAIPLANTGGDVIGLADTGTGKTLAFSLPIIQKFFSDPGMALILAPTRELVLQIANSIRDVVAHIEARMPVAVLIGGAPILFQKRQLTQKPRIIVATPGRCLDHIKQGNMPLDKINTVVLDEADRMLDMGFIDDIKKILKKIPAERQTLMFSATMPTEIEALIKHYLKEPQKVSVIGTNKEEKRITQKVCFSSLEDRVQIVTEKVQELTGKVIIFTRTKHGAAGLAKKLVTAGVEASDIHSDLSLAQRRRALEGFRGGRFQVLVATDIAARGIDVDDVELVINYDLPWSSEDYVHRIGRTGRRGRQGVALSMATPDQKSLVRRIQSATKEKITLDDRSLIINISGDTGKDSFKGGKLGGKPSGKSGGGRSRGAGRRDGSRGRDSSRRFEEEQGFSDRPRKAERQDRGEARGERHGEERRSASRVDRREGRRADFNGNRAEERSPRGRRTETARSSEIGSDRGSRGGRNAGRSQDRSQSKPTFKSGPKSKSKFKGPSERGGFGGARGHQSDNSPIRKKERRGRAFERSW